MGWGGGVEGVIGRREGVDFLQVVKYHHQQTRHSALKKDHKSNPHEHRLIQHLRYSGPH